MVSRCASGPSAGARVAALASRDGDAQLTIDAEPASGRTGGESTARFHGAVTLGDGTKLAFEAAAVPAPYGFFREYVARVLDIGWVAATDGKSPVTQSASSSSRRGLVDIAALKGCPSGHHMQRARITPRSRHSIPQVSASGQQFVLVLHRSGGDPGEARAMSAVPWPARAEQRTSPRWGLSAISASSSDRSSPSARATSNESSSAVLEAHLTTDGAAPGEDAGAPECRARTTACRHEQ
jgi:hypothetical protein